MLCNAIKRFLVVMLAVVVLGCLMPTQVLAATTVTVLDGKVSITDSATSMKESGGTVTVTAKGGLFSQTTNTITIYNKTEVKAKLTFNYNASNYGSFSQSSASGTYSVDLDAGASVTMSIKGKGSISNNTATLTLSNFSLVAISASSNITFSYDSTYGSITVGGSAVASGGVVNIASSGSALVATAASGAQFLGWVNAADGSVLSSSASYTLAPATDMSVKAVFVGANSAPWFGVGSGTQQSQAFGFLSMSKFYYHTVPSYAYLFDNLTDAITAATNGTAKYIVLANSGTLAAGTYTVPSGVTLLIPFDAANTCYATQSQWGGETMTTPTAYRTLTMANGANLVVNGAISVSGKHAYTNSGGQSNSPTGELGFVNMQSGSTITVNNGGKLYAWGYIIGAGTVTAKSGAAVYEVMQMPEFRGGSQSTGMDYNVFPLSQFYIQNIEAPLTLEAGALEYAYGTLYASKSYFETGACLFGSSSTNGMFKITSGSITKRYSGTSDRIILEINGNVEVSSIELQVDMSSINSKSYVLPINGGFTVHVKGGSSLTIPSGQDVLLQPGAQVIIEQNATCTVNSKLYIYDAAQWGAYSNWGHAGAGDTNCWDTPVIPVSYSPSRTKVRLHVFPRGLFTDSAGNPLYITEDDTIYEAIFSKNAGDLIAEADLAEFLTILSDASILVNGTLTGNIYTTADGANIYSSGTGIFTQTATANSSVYQLMMGSDYSFNSGNAEYYVEAVATPAQLKNADGTYLSSGAATYTYDSTDGAWRCAEGKHTDADNDHVCDVCYLDPCSECVDTDPADHNCDVCGKEALTECKDDDNNAVCDICGTSLCAHDWVDANCDTPKTCSKCGATDGDPLDHNYESTTVDATCMEDGSTTYTCSACGDTYSEPISALGHTASGGWLSDGTSHYKLCGVCGEATDTEACSGGMATCTAQATCKVCGKLYGTTLAHDYKTTYTYDETNHWYKCNNCSATTGIAEHSCVAGEPVSPTCTEAGYTTYTCECGYSYQGDTVAATNHKDSLTQHEAKAPTCTTVGWEAYEDCSKCTYSTYTEIPATGHTEVIDEAVAATCTTTGLTQGKHCSVCNAVITAQQTVNALGHTEVIDQAVAATCLTTGLTEGKHCSVCSEVLVSQTVTDKLAHTEEEIPAVAATCTQKGLTAGTKCSVCGTVITAPTETPMIDHTPVADAAKAPSCTETGLTEGSHCESCGETIVAQETVDALGHKEVIDKAVDATCAATGLTEGKHCSVCGEVLVAQQIVSKTEVHTWSSGICTVCEISSENVCVHEPDESQTVVVKPTCTTAGSTTYTCSICELTYVGATADALGHTEGTAATCTKDQTCTVCGAVIVKAIGHNYVAVVTAPTCTAEGYTTHTCSNCNDSYKDTYTDQVAHTPGAAVEENRIAATCTVAGSYDTVTYCTSCNAEQSRITTTIPASGHQMDAEWAETKAPTCTENGEEQKNCAKCDYYETQSIAALNHDLPEEWTVVTEATCTASGEQKRECSRCDYVETESIDKIAHTYEEAVTPPTCTEAGYTTYTCTKCGDTYTGDEVENLGHTAGTAVKENVTNPGCGTTGSYDSVEYCTICNTEMSRTSVTTDATGNHNYGDGVVTKEATCTADGVMTYTCTACGATKTEAIEAQGHDKVEHEAKTPTCINIGWDAYVTCNRCDYTTYAEKPATGKHSDSAEDTDHICDTEGCTKGMNDCSDTENDGDHKCDVCSKEAVSEHISAEAVVENNVPATCGSAGHYDSVVYCSECNTELVRETITVNATNNHSYSSSVTKEATCIDDGVRTFTCSRCGNGYTEVIPATGKHSWNNATYTAPKTCSVCGAKEGEPLVDVTEQPEDVTDEQINAAVGAIDGVINTVQPDDHGFEADANKDIVANAKDDIQLETGATATDYEAILKITMNAVVVDTGSIVTKITYDVTPLLYAKDADGKVVGSTAMTSFEEEITFRLPVDANTGARYARVHHTHNGQTIDMGLHEIHTNGDHKYVEVKSKEFSNYTVEIVDECTEHTYGTDGKCTVCGAEKPVELTGSIRLRSAALELGDKVAIIYKATDDLIATNEENVIERGVLLFDNAEKAALRDPEQAFEKVLLEWNAEEKRYIGWSEGIDARYMEKSQFAVAYLKMVDGTFIFGTRDGVDHSVEYSPLIYCRNMVNKAETTPLVRTLCCALMQYGAAAQVDQRGITTGLMNEGFDPIPYDESVLGTSVFDVNTAVVNGIRLRSATMELKGAISYIVKFTVEESLANEKLYAEYTLRGETNSVELVPGTDGRLWATIDGIFAKNLDETLRVRAYYLDDDGERVYGGELVYSGYEYIRRAQENTSFSEETKALARALAMYIYYADVYSRS